MLPVLRKYLYQPGILFLAVLWCKIAYARSIIVGGSLWQSFYIELPLLIAGVAIIEAIFQGKPRLRFWSYMVINLVVSLALFAMIVYFRYFNTLATYTSLFNANQVGDVGGTVAMLIKPVYYLMFIDLPVVLGIVAVKGLLRKPLRFIQNGWRMRTRYGAALILACLILAVVHVLQAIGGGTINEIVKARDMGILTYQAYAVYSDVKKQLVAKSQEVTPRAVRQAKGIRLADDPFMHGVAMDKDVYVIQLESFNDFLIGLEVDGQEVTPVLNELIGSSIYFNRFYQQIGKGNTSDAEFVANTSLYPTGTMAMSLQTAGRKVPSLPRYLKPYGYESVTLHTNEIKFWDRHQMYPALGFDRYYDKQYFGEEDVVHFGASDEVLYRKSLDVFREIRERGNRIYANLITMSNHNPFDLPEEKRRLKLPAHLEGTFLGNYLQSAHYADYALGTWIEEMKAAGLWEDALVVIYGDHFGVNVNEPPEVTKPLAELLGIPEYTRAQMFNVPLIIRVPGMDEGLVRHNMGGQIDILPTIMNLLGISYEDKVVFGQDLLNHDRNLIGQRTYLPGGSFINEEVIFVPGSGLEDGVMYPLEDAEMELPSPTAYSQDYSKALKLLRMSDAYIASLPALGEDAVPVDAPADAPAAAPVDAPANHGSSEARGG
jgi:phosphoglycerol transferase MdoB-like AlkP superfamily enzyme